MASTNPPVSEAPPLTTQIAHVVLLMFENRSFDNMLGGLYTEPPWPPGMQGEPAQWQYRGLNGVSPTNDAPAGPGTKGPTETFGVWQGAPGMKGIMTMPYPDPGEHFKDMNEQIFNTQRYPPDYAGTPNMLGFAANYAASHRIHHFKEYVGNPKDIMQYYCSANVPVTHALAKAYAVSDYWHGAGPVQTYPNRVFTLCATPGTLLLDGSSRRTPRINDTTGYLEHPLQPVTDPTVLELIDQGGGSWTLYQNDSSLAFDCVEYVQKNAHCIVPYEQFASDAKAGSLPTFSVIQPQYFTDVLTRNANSNHPGGDGLGNKIGDPLSIYYGEELLLEVYATLHASPSFDTTLLIVTYDEHGGLFDHVAPPSAVSPFTMGTVQGFQYDRYGPRVPAILVNPYIAMGTIWPRRSSGGTPSYPDQPDNTNPFDHTSIISTLLAQFSLGKTHLTPRDQNAPTLAGLVGPNRQASPLDPSGIALPPSKD